MEKTAEIRRYVWGIAIFLSLYVLGNTLIAPHCRDFPRRTLDQSEVDLYVHCK